MDPQLRLILEVAYEAIVDGGKKIKNKKRIEKQSKYSTSWGGVVA